MQCFGYTLEITAHREGWAAIQVECDGCWIELPVSVYRKEYGIHDYDYDCDDDHEAKFYRIDGIELSGEHLLPGIYVQQKGNKTNLIKK